MKTWPTALSTYRSFRFLSLFILLCSIATGISWQRHAPVQAWGHVNTQHQIADDTLAAETVANEWRALGPFGGTVKQLAYSPANPSLVYAVGDAGNQEPRGFRSQDSGVTWQPMGERVSFVAPHTSTANLVYRVQQDALQKSTDGGASFTTIYSNVLPQIVLSAANPNVLYSVTNSTSSVTPLLLRSADNGSTFVTRPLPFTSTNNVAEAMAVSPVNANVVYVSAFQELLRTTDGGQSWTRIPFDNPTSIGMHPTNVNIVYVSTSNSSVYKTTDGGNNWTEVKTGLPVAEFHQLAISRIAPETVYLSVGPAPDSAVGGGLYRTTNGGGSWTRSGQASLPENVAYEALALHPTNQSQMLTGSAPQTTTNRNTTGRGNLYRSTDGGAAWTISNSGFNATTSLALGFAPIAPNVIYTGARIGGPFKTTDGGSTWQPANGGLSIFGGDVGVLTVTPNNSNSVFAAGEFMRTINGGANWVFPGEFAGGATTIEVSRANPNIIYAGGLSSYGVNPSGLYRSLDGGGSWRPVFGPGNAFVVTDDSNDSQRAIPALHPTDANIVLVNAKNTLYRSNDGGNTWTTLATGVSFSRMAFSPSNPNRLLAIERATLGRIHYSTNGGASWTVAAQSYAAGSLRNLALHPTNEQIAYAAASDQGVLRTTDGGATWQAFNPGLNGVPIYDIEIDNTGSLLRAAGVGGVYEAQIDATACVAPVITIAPARRRVCEGATFTYTTNLQSGTLPVSYVWKRDGVVIPGATGSSYTGTATVGVAEGTYSVTATNACGAATATALGPVTIAYIVEGNTTVNVPATSGEGSFPGPYDDLSDWLCSGITVTSDSAWLRPTTVYFVSQLYVYDANPGPTRTGVLTMRNTTSGRSKTLTVIQAAGSGACVAPTVQIVPGTQRVCEGGGWVFSAILTAETTLPVTYVWRKNGVVIAGATGATLGSNNVALGDVGNYSVTATNACGTSTSTFPGTLTIAALDGSNSTLNVSAVGATGSFDGPYSSSNDSLCPNITVTSNVPWIRITGPTIIGVGYVVDANTGATRTGVLTMRNTVTGSQKTLTITQAAGSSGGGAVDVIWTNLINTSVMGAVLKKTAGANDGTWDGSAQSQQTIAAGASPAGEGYVEFTVSGPLAANRSAGLNGAGNPAIGDQIDHEIILTSGGYAEFREAGAYRGDVRYTTGDVFRVAIKNSRAVFSKNGTELVTGQLAPTYPLRAVARFATVGGEISNAKISTGGGTTCTYSIAPTSATVPASGFSTNTSVFAGAGCAWTATSNATWITITGGASGSGNGTVTFQIAANTGAARTGTLTIAGQTFTVAQAAGSTTCTYNLTPSSANIAATASTGSFTVNTQTGCGWMGVINASWLTINGSATGTGTGTISYSATANTGAQRTGTITVAGQTFTVTQAAGSTSGGTPVTWTNLVNTQVTGDILRKTGGSNDGTYDGRAQSQQTYSSGDVYLEFKATGPFAARSVGFTDVTTLPNLDALDYEVRFTAVNIVEFRERGVYRGDAVYKAGDTFRIAVEGTRVNFYLNGVVLASGVNAPQYPLRVFAAFATVGGEISGAQLFTGRPPTLAATTARQNIVNTQLPCRLCDEGAVPTLTIPVQRRSVYLRRLRKN